MYYHNDKVIICAQGQGNIDCSYWFTDLSYGYDQEFRDKPQLGDNVYRFDPCTGNIRIVADGFVKPNDIAFSPNEKTKYNN
ncbi:protein AkeP [Gigaspora margarita]|uniref:Protein AkeP n=1 Tax=Gigaspora margarita TaxID=4874 RepID=A0A8H4A6F3_GIGMA|nr:protein AkeP [Gigaspora margarita]